MSDDGLRALERRYRETGAVDDHAKWIVARVRAGALSESRAELAAELGHEAARLALGVGIAPLTRATIGRVVAACDAGVPAQVHGRIALAVSRLALTGELSASERTAVDDLRSWLDCPCFAHDAPLQVALDQTLVFSEDDLRALFPGPQVTILDEVIADLQLDEPIWPRDLSMVGWSHHEGRVDEEDGDDWLMETRLRHAVLDTPAARRRLTLHGVLASIRYVGAWSAVSSAIERSGDGPVRAAIAAEVGPPLLQEDEVLHG